jgi:hypothetical protein
LEDLKMSAANFATMENFPLYVLNSTTCPVCPSCGTPWDNDNGDTCLECGYQGEPEEAYDPFEDAYNSRALSAAAETVNDELAFFRVSVRSGYYFGMQFYVEEPELSPAELDNEGCRYNWDMCRSVAIRRRNAEIRKVNRWLERTAREYGMMKLVCVGRFSNGECLYQEADSRAAVLKAVSCGIPQHIPADAGQIV